MPLLKKLPHKFLYLAIPVIVVVIIGILELTNATHFFHAKKPVVNLGTGSAETKGESSAQNVNKNTSNNQASSEDNKTTTNTSATLLDPSGNFVSNHSPGLNSAISSDCTTTSGANCQIIFTKDGVSRSLASQTTDRGGATFWSSWTPASIGLTAGTWKVQATATLGTQTKTSFDALNLEVSP